MTRSRRPTPRRRSFPTPGSTASPGTSASASSSGPKSTTPSPKRRSPGSSCRHGECRNCWSPGRAISCRPTDQLRQRASAVAASLETARTVLRNAKQLSEQYVTEANERKAERQKLEADLTEQRQIQLGERRRPEQARGEAPQTPVGNHRRPGRTIADRGETAGTRNPVASRHLRTANGEGRLVTKLGKFLVLMQASLSLFALVGALAVFTQHLNWFEVKTATGQKVAGAYEPLEAELKDLWAGARADRLPLADRSRRTRRPRKRNCPSAAIIM